MALPGKGGSHLTGWNRRRSAHAARRFSFVPALHGCGVGRARSPGIDRWHHWPRGVAGVVGLEIPLADIARREPIAAIAAGEGRNSRPLVVPAERTHDLTEA